MSKPDVEEMQSAVDRERLLKERVATLESALADIVWNQDEDDERGCWTEDRTVGAGYSDEDRKAWGYAIPQRLIAAGRKLVTHLKPECDDADED